MSRYEQAASLITFFKTVLAHDCKYDSLSSVYKIELVAGVILLALFIRLEACFFSLSHCLDNSLTLCLCSVQKAFIALAELVCLFDFFFLLRRSPPFFLSERSFSAKLFALGLFFLLVIHCKVLLLMYSY